MAATTSMTTPNTMLAIPEKKTASIDLYLPLRQYISSAYSEADALRAEEDLKTVNQMRVEIERNQTGTIASRRDLLQDYFKALSVMETRFPITPKGSHIRSVWFTWWDAFRPRNKASQQNIHLEKAAVLFNLGVAYCRIGLACDRSVVEGRRDASHSFIAAAGVFCFLRDNEAVKASMESSAMVDLSVECAGMLESLMLAQAQECVFENAVEKGSSLGVLAKISRQVGIYYEEALTALNAAPLSQHVDKGWMFHVQVKAAFFYAEACYRYCLELHEKEAIGEEIARLRSGIDTLSEAKKSARGVAIQLLDSVETLERNMKHNLDRALKENDRVYLMRVPLLSSLSPLPAVSLVKPMPMNDVLDASTDKLFSTLVPDTSAKAVSRYTEMVDDIIRTHVEKLQEASELKRLRLTEMGLPDSLLVLEGSFVLPEDLKKDVEAIQRSEGVAGLEAEILQLKDFRRVNQELLNQTQELLHKEAKEDDQLRSKYGTQWVRPQSNNLTKNLQERLDKFADNLKQAADSDAKIERSLMEHATLMSILDYHPIESALPALARPIMSLYVNENDVVETLRQNLGELESISSHLASLEDMLKDMKNKDDILPKLMSSTGSYEDLFKIEISKYEKFSEEIVHNVEAQEQTLMKIKAQNEKFSFIFNMEDYKASREKSYKQIRSAIVKYREVKANLNEGLKFYVTLQDAVMKVKQQCSDFVMTRNIQCQEMVEEVKRKVSGLFFQENNYRNSAQPRQDQGPTSQNVSPTEAPFNRASPYDRQPQQPGSFPRPPYTKAPFHRECHNALESFRDWRLEHVLREAKPVANLLAQKAREDSWSWTSMEAVPSFLSLVTLKDRSLAGISDYLSHLNLGPCTIESRLEAYSCKHTSADKKLSFSLENEILDYLGKSAESGSSSPADSFLCRSSRRTLIYLVLTLNHMYPDYDFSAVQAHQYFSEESWDSFKNTVETYLVDVREEWSEGTEGSLIEALKKALDEVIKLSECEIYSYNPTADADPLIEKGSIWSFNFFFYNKRLKRVVGFCCSSLSNSLNGGFLEGETVSDVDGEIFDTMDI
ncbi:unnamed protein product [Rhodiola kirilowii]